MFNKNAYELLSERGFIHTCTHPDELKKLLEKPITFYLGIDPTADNLHIGHFFALQIFKILQDHGHKGILLIGNATAMVGDPSFKNDMRKILSQTDVDHNAHEINGLLGRFINLRGENPAVVVHNADWIRKMSYIDFMRTVGAHMNVAGMLSKECYKNRIKEGGLTFLEMGYMPMQAYDFVHLNDVYGCVLQIGGSDQWANIVAGTELSRKMSFENGAPRPTMIGLCCPLLVKADGTKMGKTEKGTLWVSRSENGAYDCFQHFVNVFDEDVERLLMFFTLLPATEIKQMCKKDIVGAKKLMAFEVTKKIHGEVEATKARDTAEKLFSTGGAPADVPTIAITTLGDSSEQPLIVDVLVFAKLCDSKREARELIANGAIAIDDVKITDIGTRMTKPEILIKKGKKTFLRVKIQ